MRISVPPGRRTRRNSATPARGIGEVLDQLAREQRVEGGGAEGERVRLPHRPPHLGVLRLARAQQVVVDVGGDDGEGPGAADLGEQAAAAARVEHAGARRDVGQEQALEPPQHRRVQLEQERLRQACSRGRRARGGSRSAAPRGRPPSPRRTGSPPPAPAAAGRAGCPARGRTRSRGSTTSPRRPAGPAALRSRPTPARWREIDAERDHRSPSGSGNTQYPRWVSGWLSRRWEYTSTANTYVAASRRRLRTRNAPRRAVRSTTGVRGVSRGKTPVGYEKIVH